MQAMRAWTRSRYDGCNEPIEVRVTTGPGRYALNDPATTYCNATLAPEPTNRAQRWGAATVAGVPRADVESDLFNLRRHPVRDGCGQYDAAHNAMNAAAKTPAVEASFPQTATRLGDPPATLRGTGWNRWEWTCQDPQQNAMPRFDYQVSTRLATKDTFVPCLPVLRDPTSELPAPLLAPAGAAAVPQAAGRPGGGAQDAVSFATPAFLWENARAAL
jgi:hypothetical protein